MKRDFEKWHKKKAELDAGGGTALFNEREVWWCSLGANVGFEQDGSGELFTRPVVILSKFNLDTCLIVPLTTKPKIGKYYFPLGKVSDKEAVAVLSQIRFIDRKRMAVKIDTLDKKIFRLLVKEIVSVCLPDALK